MWNYLPLFWLSDYGASVAKDVCIRGVGELAWPVTWTVIFLLVYSSLGAMSHLRHTIYSWSPAEGKRLRTHGFGILVGAEVTLRSRTGVFLGQWENVQGVRWLGWSLEQAIWVKVAPVFIPGYLANHECWKLKIAICHLLLMFVFSSMKLVVANPYFQKNIIYTFIQLWKHYCPY